jgi:uncharacterized membrane protein
MAAQTHELHARDPIQTTGADHGYVHQPPAIRAIGPSDIAAALRAGWADFMAKPSHIIFLGLIYPIVGVLLAYASANANLLPLLFPLLAGFALIGPFAGLGLYEISRRREQGLDASWSHALEVFNARSIGAILVLGALLTGLFIAWLATALGIYNWAFAGVPHPTAASFLADLFDTPAGWTLIVVGNTVGFLFAVAALMLSVVSFPMLIDRDVGVGVAIQTSINAVFANPGAMALWGMTIAAGLALGSALLFIGLAVVIPVLAHATWHLYRRVVAD